MKMFRNRLVAGTAAVSALAMTLAGCGGNDATASDKPTLSTEPVTISLNWWGADKRMRLTEEAVDLFEQKNPNIKIETQYADFTGYWDKLATSVAGGNAPDVMQLDETYLSEYAGSGTLYDLGKVSDYLDMGQMDKSLADTGKYQGVQYAAPHSILTYATMVNNDILKDLGIELPDTKTWTWDDFEKLCQQVIEKSNGEINGSFATAYVYSVQLWARQHGESLYKDGKVAISPEVLAEYLERPKTWADKGVSFSVDRWAENIVATADMQLINTGKQAISIGPTNGIVNLVAHLPEADLSIEPLPSDNHDIKWNYFKPSMMWGISSKTEHPAEAAKLVDFLINDKDAAKILGTDRGEPGNNEIREELIPTLTGGEKMMAEFDSTQSDTLGDAPEPTPKGASDAEKIISRYVQDVSFGRISAIDGANALINEINGNIDAAK